MGEGYLRFSTYRVHQGRERKGPKQVSKISMNESTAKLPGYGFQDVILELMLVNDNIEKIGKTFNDIKDVLVPIQKVETRDESGAPTGGKSKEELEELKKIRGEIYQTNLMMGELLGFFTSKKLQELEDRKEFIDLLKTLRVKDKGEKKEAPLKMGWLGKALLGIPAAIAGFVTGLIEGIKDALNTAKNLLNFGKGIGTAAKGLRIPGKPGTSAAKRLGTPGKAPGVKKVPARGPGGRFKKASGGILDDIAQTFSRMVDAIGDWWKGLKKSFPMLDDVAKWATKTFAPIGKFITRIFTFARSIGRVFGKLLLPLQVVLSIFDFVTGFIEDFQKTEGDVVDKSIAGIRGGVRELIKGIIAVPLDLIKSLVSWVAGKLGFEEVEKALDSFKFVNIVDEMSRLGVFDFFLFPIKAAQGFIKGFTETEGSLTEKIVASFKLGVMNLVDSLLGGFMRLIQSGVAWVASALGAEDLANALKTVDPMDAIKAVFFKAVDSFTEFFEGIGNALSKLFSGEGDVMTRVMGYFKEAMAVMVSSFLAPINMLTEPFGYKITDRALESLGLPKPDVAKKTQPGGSFKPKEKKKETAATVAPVQAVAAGTPGVIPMSPEMGDVVFPANNTDIVFPANSDTIIPAVTNTTANTSSQENNSFFSTLFGTKKSVVDMSKSISAPPMVSSDITNNITGSTITEYGKSTNEILERVRMISMSPAIASSKNSAPTIVNSSNQQTTINQSTAVERTTILLNPMFSYA